MKRISWFLIPTLIAQFALGNGEVYSPNMNLPVPTVGVTTGPTYANDINASLRIIDAHDHSPGYGVPVTPSGLNISSDLTCQDNNLTNIRTTRFFPQASLISGAGADIGALYESGVDLYFNDGSGNQIRITQSGSVTGATGTITGLPSGTAGAAYASGAFIFSQATSTPANIDAAAYILRYPGSYPAPSGNYLALQAPSTLATGFALTFPGTLPGTTGFWMTSNTSGSLSWSGVDNSTLQYSANVFSIKAGGVGSTQIATGGVATANIAAGAVTAAKLAVVPALTAVDLTTTQTWSVPLGVSIVEISGCGGGAGGGSGFGSLNGGGGQGAPLGVRYLTVTPGGSVSVVIGAGGAGSSSSARGAPGGTTSFGAINFFGGIGGSSGGTGIGGGVGDTGTAGGAVGGTSGAAGQSSANFSGGAAGSGGGGSGGGAGPFGVGADGSASGGGPGASAGANTCAGGGSGNAASASNGGAGGSGRIQVLYVVNQ